METELIIRGRHITEQDLHQVRSVVAELWEQGRVAISRRLCRLWDWRQENGHYKEQVCRILLRRLESLGLITLPPPKHVANPPGKRYYVPPVPPPEIDETPLEGSVRHLGTIRLAMVRRTPDEKLWNYLVHRYHYKGYKIIVGAHLKYLAWADERPIACLSWSSSVFRIADRDRFIGWEAAARSANIRYVVNNSRFLILPWIQVKNLASYLLGLSARTVGRDWEAFYGYPIFLLETFVDQARFRGTCYKAANWVRVGETKGYAKKNTKFYKHGRKKDVLVYPLADDFRSRMQYIAHGGGR